MDQFHPCDRAGEIKRLIRHRSPRNGKLTHGALGRICGARLDDHVAQVTPGRAAHVKFCPTNTTLHFESLGPGSTMAWPCSRRSPPLTRNAPAGALRVRGGRDAFFKNFPRLRSIKKAKDRDDKGLDQSTSNRRAWGRQQRCRAQDRVCWKSSPRYDAWLALAQEVRPMACGVMPVLRAI